MATNSGTDAVRRGKGAATIYDVAELAGVSPSTVSRALGKPGRISATTEARIRVAAEQLSFRINPMARALHTGRTHTLALVVADITNPVIFGIVRGAIASSIGHDSHNVCVIGCTDADMAAAVNRLIELRGGFAAAVDGKVVGELALPIAGLMSDQPFETVEQGLRALRAAVRSLGTPLHEPFLQMAFLALPVIPHLRITDKGLVDVDRFALI